MLFSNCAGPDVGSVFGAAAYFSGQYEMKSNVYVKQNRFECRLARRPSNNHSQLTMVIKSRRAENTILQMNNGGMSGLAFEWYDSRGVALHRCFVGPFLSSRMPKEVSLARGELTELTVLTDGLGTSLFASLEPGHYYIRTMYSPIGWHKLYDHGMCDLDSIVSNFVKCIIKADGTFSFENFAMEQF